jgi:hypothetical protein
VALISYDIDYLTGLSSWHFAGMSRQSIVALQFVDFSALISYNGVD